MTEQHKPYAKLSGFAVLFLLLMGLVGCTVPPAKPFESPLPPATEAAAQPAATSAGAAATAAATPAPVIPVTPAADKGVIVGTIRNSVGSLPEGAKVFAAKFVWNDAKTVGVYYLDPAHALSWPVDPAGAFQVPDLDPGPYVLVVGVTPEKAVPIMGEKDQARVIDVAAGQVTDLGEQTITLQ